MSNCRICDLYATGHRLKEYIGYHLIIDGDTIKAIWHKHETEKEIGKYMCTCKILTMKRTLEIKAKKHFGCKVIIDGGENEEHIYFSARKF